VAQEKSGACGGLFTSRAAALKFAKFESGEHPHAVVMVNGILELNMFHTRRSNSERGHADAVRHLHSVA
jgi:hypothetical protein